MKKSYTNKISDKSDITKKIIIIIILKHTKKLFNYI